MQIVIFQKINTKIKNTENTKKNDIINKEVDLEEKRKDLKNSIYTKQTNNRMIDSIRNEIVLIKKDIFELEKSTKYYNNLIKREDNMNALINSKKNKIFTQKLKLEENVESNKMHHEDDIEYYKIVIDRKLNFIKVR